LSCNEDDYVSLTLKKMFAGLSVIMLLIMGGGLSIVILDMMLNIADRVGMAEYWITAVCIMTLWACIPNLMIIAHGFVFFSKLNSYNCAFQLGVTVSGFIYLGLELWPLHVASILFQSLCALVLRSASYEQFVEYYYYLQTNRRRERKELKAAIARLKHDPH
jgi:hypothetical protein